MLCKKGWSEHTFELLVGSVYMNCEGVRKEENIFLFLFQYSAGPF